MARKFNVIAIGTGSATPRFWFYW